ASRLVRDDGDPLALFQSKTNIDRIVRAGDQFRINRIEISSIRHTESCQNYSEIERWQTLWSATLSGSDLSEFHKSHGARDYEERIEHAGGNRHAEGVIDKGEEKILADVAHHGATETDRFGNSHEVAFHQRDAGAFNGNVRSGSHCNSHVRGRQRRRVVDSV